MVLLSANASIRMHPHDLLWPLSKLLRLTKSVLPQVHTHKNIASPRLFLPAKELTFQRPNCLPIKALNFIWRSFRLAFSAFGYSTHFMRVFVGLIGKLPTDPIAISNPHCGPALIFRRSYIHRGTVFTTRIASANATKNEQKTASLHIGGQRRMSLDLL